MFIQLGLTTFASVFAWEHFGRLYNWNVRPSFALENIANASVDAWMALGEFCARALQFLKLKELANTAVDLVRPIWTGATSFVYFVKGFGRRMWSWELDTSDLWKVGAFLVVLTGGVWFFFSNSVPERAKHVVGGFVQTFGGFLRF